MTRLTQVVCTIVNDPTDGRLVTTDVHQESPQPKLMNLAQAGAAQCILSGFWYKASSPYNGIFRGYIKFDLGLVDWATVKVIRTAYIKLVTRQVTDPGGAPWEKSYVNIGSDAKVRIHRLTATPNWANAGDGMVQNISGTPPGVSHWANIPTNIDHNDWVGEHWDEAASAANKGETRVRCTKLVGLWAPAASGGHPVLYADPEQGPNLQTCQGLANHGVVVKAPDETTGDQRAEFYSGRPWTDSTKDGLRPLLVINYEEWNPKPADPRLIEPKATTEEPTVPADFVFRGSIVPTDADSPITSVTIEVKAGGPVIWSLTSKVTPAWPDEEFAIPNPRQPTLPTGSGLFWHAKATTAGFDGDFSSWEAFTVARKSPTVAAIPKGSVTSLLEQKFQAVVVTPP